MAALVKAGFSILDADALRLIARTLHRWDERQCGDGVGCVTVDDVGHAWWESPGQAVRIPNRGAGAERRLAAVMARYPNWVAYHQTDCRGPALFVCRRSDVDVARLDATYNRGIAVVTA